MENQINSMLAASATEFNTEDLEKELNEIMGTTPAVAKEKQIPTTEIVLPDAPSTLPNIDVVESDDVELEIAT